MLSSIVRAIEAAVAREEGALGIERSVIGPAMSDLLILLLDAPGSRGDEAIRGMTRLQKLLFVVEQTMSPNRHFYAYDYGPFDEAVHDAAESLRLAGFLRGSSAVKPTPPSFAEMMETASQRAGPRESGQPEVFVLSENGHQAAERIRRSSRLPAPPHCPASIWQSVHASAQGSNAIYGRTLHV